MFQLLPEYDIVRDFLYIIQVAASFVIFYLSYQSAKRIKDAGFASATTGLTILLIGIGIFHLNAVLSHYYSELNFFLLGIITDIIFLSSLTLLVILAEIDYVEHSQAKKAQKLERIKYPLSLISIMGSGILGVLSFIGLFPAAIPFIFIIFPVLITASRHFRQFEKLENVRSKNPIIWSTVGLSLAGFSNFFPALVPLFGEWLLLLYSFCVISGGIILLKSWEWVPHLSELDWLLKLDKLLVVDQESSLVLFENVFQTSESLGTESKTDSLTGPAISGISMLLEEILATEEKLHVIDHGDKKLYFAHGNRVTCILFARGISPEFEYRLNLFVLLFEKQFDDILKDWDGNVMHFKPAKNLIEKTFTH